MVHRRCCKQMLVVPAGFTNSEFVGLNPTHLPDRNTSLNSVAAANNRDEVDFYRQISRSFVK